MNLHKAMEGFNRLALVVIACVMLGEQIGDQTIGVKCETISRRAPPSMKAARMERITLSILALGVQP